MDHVPQHCQELAEQIGAETDEAKREVLRAVFREQCQGEPDDGEAAPLSGGHGPRPPIKPPEDPEPGTLRSGGHGPRPPQAE